MNIKQTPTEMKMWFSSPYIISTYELEILVFDSKHHLS